MEAADPESLRTHLGTSRARQDSSIDSHPAVMNGALPQLACIRGSASLSDSLKDVDILVVPDEGIGSGRIDRELKVIISRGAADLGLDESRVKVGPPPRASSATPDSFTQRGTRPPRRPKVSILRWVRGEELCSGSLFRSGRCSRNSPRCTLHAAAIAAEAGDLSSMARAGRHNYDAHALLVSQGLIERLSEESIEDLMSDIADVSTRNGWAFHPRPESGFASSPAFARRGRAVDQGRISYEAARGLIYSQTPTFESCLATIGRASAHL